MPINSFDSEFPQLLPQGDGIRPLLHWPRAMQQLNSGAIFLANLTEGRSDAPDSFSKAPRLKLVLCLVCVLFGLSCFRDADGSGLWSTAAQRQRGSDGLEMVVVGSFFCFLLRGCERF